MLLLPGSAGGPFVGRLAGLAGWQAVVVVRRAEGLTYFHVLLHTRFPHQMALNAGVHTHDISILTTSSSCAALKETSINELANYKSLVQNCIWKGAVPSNHRERFKTWFLIIQFVGEKSLVDMSLLCFKTKYPLFPKNKWWKCLGMDFNGFHLNWTFKWEICWDPCHCISVKHLLHELKHGIYKRFCSNLSSRWQQKKVLWHCEAKY